MASASAAAGALPGRFRRAFGWRIGLRLAGLAAALAAAAWAAAPPTLAASALVAVALALACGLSLWREVRRTNLELARLLTALRHGDFTARFEAGAAPGSDDAGFAELASAAQALLAQQEQRRLHEQRRGAELLAVLEHVPTPLLAVDDAGRVSLLNHAARRLLHEGMRLGASLRAADFAGFGPELVGLLQARGPSAGTVALQPAGDAGVRLRVAVSEALLDGRAQRLIALQPIQAELDDAETRLASGLVRVLTHEVMNSLTPVAALLRTAGELGQRLADDGSDDTRARLQRALDTATRRSEGLLGFVERYRVLARPPQVRPGTVDAAALAETLAELFQAEWPAPGPTLELRLPDPSVRFRADRELLEPVLMNLLRNAAQAAQAAQAHAAAARVRLSIRRSASGRVLIDVEDNGPGIPAALRDDVFLPFFTTKPGGHGVGLALARQTVLAHRGSLHADTSPDLGGARLRIAL